MARTSVLTGGSNTAQATSEDFNAVATDFLFDGIVGAFTNTGGISPATGGLALNAQGTPNTTTALTAGTVWVTATPTSQASQRLRVKIDAQNITHSSNTSGSTRYDWIYVKVDAALAANPDASMATVGTVYVSRSTSNSVDNGTPPTYGVNIAIVTLTNTFTTVVNANITDKRAQSGVTAGALTTSTIKLGYASITGNFSTTSTSQAQITALSAAVTIPAGGRSIKITGYFGSWFGSGSPSFAHLGIWDGTVGAGTQLALSRVPYQTNLNQSCTVVAIVTPSAGAKTYNLGFDVNGGTGTIEASATQPAFILVEAI